MIYRPDAPWRFNELQSRVEEDGQVRESVALMRQLFAAEPWRYSALLRVNEMVKECWLASDNCVLMQLSAHLAISRDTLEDRLNDIHDNWQEEGIMPRDILELGKALQRSVYVLGENRLLLKYEADSKEKGDLLYVCSRSLSPLQRCKMGRSYERELP